ncbi:MAG: hypothetical protein E2598_02640 [Sphingobium sp.]|nr:hypothetical protein [Sphingobium sp.]
MMHIMMGALVMAGASVPTQAEVAHQTSLNHEGQMITVSYTPKVETSYRQTGFGPREPIRCFWQTSVSVERAAVTNDGQPVAALSRVVDLPVKEKGVKTGMRGVHCSALPASDVAAFGGDTGQLQRYLAEAAVQDKAGLHRELASLGSGSRAGEGKGQK